MTRTHTTYSIALMDDGYAVAQGCLGALFYGTVIAPVTTGSTKEWAASRAAAEAEADRLTVADGGHRIYQN